MLNPRDLLIYLSVKYKGQFEKMFSAIKVKEKVEEEDVKKALKDLGSKAITILDKEYPESFKRIHTPPLVLFYKGDLSLLNDDKQHLGVVGSRDISKYGENITKEIVSELVKDENSPVIISGLSRGIDTIAHEECLKNHGKTVAILGCGINYVYPKQNADLYNKIAKDGLLLSEYPDETEPEKNNFNMRNRIVAGLSDKLLVPEAYKNSGTNLTVMFALQQGKDVMAIPHNVGKECSCNKLIQDGAFLVENAEDVKYIMKDFSKNKGIKMSEPKVEQDEGPEL